MHNIIYKKGMVESELFEIVNIHKPFHSKVDKVKRKASLSKLIISPAETRNSNQIKRFLVSVGSRYAYKMHVTYKNSLKCHSIYDTNSSVDKLLRNTVIKYIVDNVDEFPDLKHDLINVVRVLTKAWNFDGVITDIPWLKNQYDVPVIVPVWNLASYSSSKPLEKSINLVLSEYGNIPLNLLPAPCLEAIQTSETNIVDPGFQCPLILMRSNSLYSGMLSNLLGKGLPVTLFKISGKVY